jgi:hypothetical protein
MALAAWMGNQHEAKGLHLLKCGKAALLELKADNLKIKSGLLRIHREVEIARCYPKAE